MPLDDRREDIESASAQEVMVKAMRVVDAKVTNERAS
jgi:hypothetical protein